MKKFKFSIVMAVYNTADYLEEAIDSLIAQSIGFRKNIQLILVNDGSTDGSHDICEKYADKYKKNIVYIKKENGGVSSARNLGLSAVEGELVNFLDGDDLLSDETLENVYHFYKKHEQEVDLISIPLMFFEARQGNHVLNKKFTRSRVIDIQKEPLCFQMSISSSFVKREVLLQYRFNEKLKYGEDAEVVNKIILQRGQYGVVREAAYHYRVREAGGSAIQKARQSKEQYLDVLHYLHFELMKVSEQVYGTVIPYLQNMMMYETIFKLRVPKVDEKTLTQAEIDAFFEDYHRMAVRMDDNVILGCGVGSQIMKLWSLQLKHQLPLQRLVRTISSGNDVLFVRGNRLISLLSQYKVEVKSVTELKEQEKKEDCYKAYEVCGFLRIPAFDDSIRLYREERFCTENHSEWKEEYLEAEECPEDSVYSLGRLVCKGYSFRWKVFAKEKGELHVARVFAGCQETKIPLAFRIREGLVLAEGVTMKDREIRLVVQ